MCIFREGHLLLELRRTIINCEFCIYIVSFIIILAVCLVHCLCIGSLLIYVNHLFDFVSVAKYGSSSGRAVGRTFKLGPTRIFVRLEFSRRSSIDDEIVIFILFDISNVASWFQGLLVLGEQNGWPDPLVGR